jgi:hypothetical protein
VQGTGGALTINGQNGHDQVFLDNAGSVQGIQRGITITNTGSFTDLFVNDSADNTSHSVTLDADPTHGTITGLAPNTISYNVADVSSVTVDSGRGNDLIFVRSTRGLAPVTVNAGFGNDAIIVASTSNTLDAIEDPLTCPLASWP